MSNNLLDNTTSLQNILEALQNKATPSGENVADETNTYTEKLEQLTTAVTALEEELAGKAGGGAVVATWNGVVYGAQMLGDNGIWDIHYIDGELNHQSFQAEAYEEYPITILANSFIGCECVDMPGYFRVHCPDSENFEFYIGGN